MKFESGFNPENEEKVFDPEAAQKMESSILERFTGKAKNIARVLILTSLLSFGMGTAKEAYAEDKNPNDPTEQTEKADSTKTEKKLEINEAKLTESGKFARSVVESARADMEKVGTAEDANWLIRTYLNQLVSEFFEPTQGDVKEGAYGVRIVDRSRDDASLWAESAEEMKEIIEELNQEYGIEAFDKRTSQIETIIEKLKKEASFSYQAQKKMMEEVEKSLGK